MPPCSKNPVLMRQILISDSYLLEYIVNNIVFLIKCSVFALPLNEQLTQYIDKMSCRYRCYHFQHYCFWNIGCIVKYREGDPVSPT